MSDSWALVFGPESALPTHYCMASHSEWCHQQDTDSNTQTLHIIASHLSISHPMGWVNVFVLLYRNQIFNVL